MKNLIEIVVLVQGKGQDEALICEPGIANFYRLKSRIQFSLGCFDKALNMALKSLDLEPNNKHGLIDMLNAAVKAEKQEYINSAAERLYSEFSDITYKKYLQ